MSLYTRYTIEEKIQLLNQKKASGLTAMEWCKQNDVSYGTFKSFAAQIRDYNYSNAPQLKRAAEKKQAKRVPWISSAVENEETDGVFHPQKPDVHLPAKATFDITGPYIIQIGDFKIHVSESYTPESLKALVEVVRQCS